MGKRSFERTLREGAARCKKQWDVKIKGKNYLFSERRPRCRNGKNNMPIVVPTRWSRRGKTDSRYRKFTLLNVEPSECAMELHAGAIRAKTCCRIVFPKCQLVGPKGETVFHLHMGPCGSHQTPLRPGAPPRGRAVTTSMQYMAPAGGLRPRRKKVPYILKDRKSTRLNSSHSGESRMPSSA